MKRIVFLLFSIIFTFSIFSQSSSTDTIVLQQNDKVSLIKKVENWYAQNMNYATITALMTVESSFVPFPSEIVVPPAAYIASQHDSKLNIFLVVLFATLGAILGALINYYLALWLGRAIVYRFAGSRLGKILLLSPEKIEKAEQYFNEKGNISTFVGRLIPGIRQLISIPAGLAKMNMANFLLYTTLGAGIWNSILALLGYLAHGQKDLIDKYNKELSLIILIIFGIVIIYFVIKWIVKKRNKK